MLTMEEALALLAAVGTDAAPSAEQLRSARAIFVDAAKVAKTKADKQSLATMLETIRTTDLAITAAVELETAAAAELDALAADIPELNDDAPAEPVADEPDAPQMLSVSEAIQRLGLAPAAATPPVEVEDRPTQILTVGGNETVDATWRDLGDAFAKHSKSMLRAGKTTLASFRTEYTNQLTGKTGPDTRLLDDLSRAANDEAVVAAGGCCSLAEPIRDQPMLASLARPIADALPTIGATAGAVTLYPPICLPQSGVYEWTCTQDEEVDPDDPETWKQCSHVECADAETVIVDAIYRCLTIGNFQQRFSPERWDAILHAATAQHARLAEQALFSKIQNSPHTTAHTVTDSGSIYATFLREIIMAAATIRQNQRYQGVRMRVIAPSWLQDAITADRLMRAIQRGRTVEGASIDTLLGERDIDVIWSPDLNPIEPNGQVSGALTQYPATANVVLFADGGVFRLDGGELNLGTEIRDHDLNRQNNVAAFAESFESALVRSCDTKAITLPVTVCNTAPCQPAPAPGATEDAPLFTQEVVAG